VALLATKNPGTSAVLWTGEITSVDDPAYPIVWRSVEMPPDERVTDLAMDASGRIVLAHPSSVWAAEPGDGCLAWRRLSATGADRIAIAGDELVAARSADGSWTTVRLPLNE
jgi:hypothetical protein